MTAKPRSEAALESLVVALRSLLRSGLPLGPDTAPLALVSLKGAVARSVDPDDRLAQIDGLDRLLRAELQHFGLVKLRKPAQALFGVGASAGLSLTERRHRAATIAGYELDHFRKRIEPKICRQLAWQLHQDSLRYQRRSGGSEPLEASGPTPTIQAEHLDRPDTADHEILLSRIWSDVYGLRAELILCEQINAHPDRQVELEEAELGSKWFLARLLTNLDRYLDRYGQAILHGAAEHDARSLIRLAGWTGDLTDQQARDLKFDLARAGWWDRSAFRRANVAASADGLS